MTPRRVVSSRDGLPLAYWVRQAPVTKRGYLLLVHGAASNHTRWSEFVDHTRLSPHWHIVCPDLRGNGESMTRGRQNMNAWCDDLIEVLCAEHADRALIGGHSLGAQIAINFAHRNPGRTRGLILIDPVFQTALQGRQAMVRRHRWFFRSLAAIARGLNAVGIYRRHIEDRDLRELDEETRQAIRGAESLEAIAKRYGSLGPILRHMPTGNYIRQALATVDPVPPPGDIAVPVLVLLSGGTTLANLDINRAEAARFPDNEIVTLPANHWPLTETPDAVRTAIENWVTRRFPNG